MKSQYLKKLKMPNNPGVYLFKKDNKILYIGKATSLKRRVRSYFSKDLIATRGSLILDMVVRANKLEWQETDTVLEALILEANLIKKYKPKYNTKEKDNKSFSYVCITKDKLPRVSIIRERTLDKKKYKKVFGPFTSAKQLREIMKIIRPIFPYFDDDSLKKNNKEFYKQLGLVPEKEYKKNIKNLKLFFEGKKKSVLSNMKKEMITFAKKKEFEKAAIMKKRIFSLGHINDLTLIEDKDVYPLGSPWRIEAYDVAHMSGKNMVGVMTVITNGEINKNQYRKFIIRTQADANDTGALREIMNRRIHHVEWGLADLIVVDGGKAQMNVVKNVLSGFNFKIHIVGVVKDDRHKPKALMGDKDLIKKYKKEILIANNEAHRFAIAFHKAKRNANFIK